MAGHLGDEASKADVEERRGTDDEERDQEELNGNGRRSGQRVARGRLSLD